MHSQSYSAFTRWYSQGRTGFIPYCKICIGLIGFIFILVNMHVTHLYLYIKICYAQDAQDLNLYFKICNAQDAKDIYLYLKICYAWDAQDIYLYLKICYALDAQDLYLYFKICYAQDAQDLYLYFKICYALCNVRTNHPSSHSAMNLNFYFILFYFIS